jgi:hypothetical protein
LKTLDQERTGAGNDGDIEAEEQSSQGRRGSQEDQVGEIDFSLHDASRKGLSGNNQSNRRRARRGKRQPLTSELPQAGSERS